FSARAELQATTRTPPTSDTNAFLYATTWPASTGTSRLAKGNAEFPHHERKCLIRNRYQNHIQDRQNHENKEYEQQRFYHPQEASSTCQLLPCPYTKNVGTPQGNVLSPTLYNLYILELSKSIESPIQLLQYADDTLVFLETDDITEGINIIEKALKKINTYFQNIHLTFFSARAELQATTRTPPTSDTNAFLYATTWPASTGTSRLAKGNAEFPHHERKCLIRNRYQNHIQDRQNHENKEYEQQRFYHPQEASSTCQLLPCPYTKNVGTPQGNVLSPTLYNLYILELSKSIESPIQLLQYADDTLVFLETDDITEGINIIEKALKKINTYFQNIHLTFFSARAELQATTRTPPTSDTNAFLYATTWPASTGTSRLAKGNAEFPHHERKCLIRNRYQNHIQDRQNHENKEYEQQRFYHPQEASSTCQLLPCPYTKNVGTPQGNVLSPTLYNLYILELSKSIESPIQLLQYADDTLVFLETDDITEGINIIEKALKKINTYFQNIHLTFFSARAELQATTRTPPTSDTNAFLYATTWPASTGTSRLAKGNADLEQRLLQKNHELRLREQEIADKDYLMKEKDMMLQEKCQEYDKIIQIAEKRKSQIDLLRFSVKSRDDALTELTDKNKTLISQEILIKTDENTTFIEDKLNASEILFDQITSNFNSINLMKEDTFGQNLTRHENLQDLNNESNVHLENFEKVQLTPVNAVDFHTAIRTQIF
ncbi:unnamed protein product, partial [Trichogramma brassicae]